MNFVLAHLGAFLVIRDLLEISKVKAIEDENGVKDLGEGTYVLPKSECTRSETLNYILFAKGLINYSFLRAKSLNYSEVKNKIKEYKAKL